MSDGKSKVGGGLISGTLSLTVSTVIVKLLGLIYKIPISNLLGDEGMGYFNSAYTVYAFFYLLCTAGVPKAVMILVSETKAAGKRIEEATIVRMAARSFLLLGAAVTAVFIVFSGPIARFIGNSNSFATMIAIAPSIIFVSLAGVIRGYLSADMKLLVIAVSQIIEGVGKLATGLLFAMLGYRLCLPLPIISALTVLGVTLGSFFGLVHLMINSKIKLLDKNARQNKIDGVFRRILSISIPITLSAAAMSLTNIVDLMIIMRRLVDIGYSESEATALYGNYTTLAVPMFNLALSLLTPISIAFLPVFTRYFVTKNDELLGALTKSALEMTAFVAAPIMMGLTVFSEEILSLLFGSSSADVGAKLLIILSSAIPFSSVLLIVNTLLESRGIVRAPLVSMIFGCIAKIITSYLLLSDPNFGISGAPIGTVISYAVALTVSMITLSVKCRINIPVITKSILPYLNAFISVAAAKLLYGYIVFNVGEVISLIASVLAAAILYLAFSRFCGIINSKKIYEMSKYTKFA